MKYSYWVKQCYNGIGMRSLLSGVMTPICGAKLSDLKCSSHDSTVCNTICPKSQPKERQLELPI
jgi:hypothetical protein